MKKNNRICLQIGLVILLFLFFLLKGIFLKIRNIKADITDYSMLLLFGAILIIMFFDHSFWTLQQGRLILWLILGIVTSLTNRGHF